MAQEVLIPTATTVTINGQDITIYTYYNGDITNTPGIIQAFIAEESSAIGFVSYVEGELIVVMKDNYAASIYLDSNGNLILEAEDSQKYYIDENGYLFFDDSL